MGPVGSYWGAQRAMMGHAAPFSIYAVAIGNEDCGKPQYAANYQIFYDQLSAAWPNVKLISNCDPSDPVIKGHPTQLWDYHIYTSAEDLFAMGSTEFDNPHWRSASNAKIFNSEYAVTRGAGNGNAKAAVGEAGWMNGLERNSDLVTIASYAPILINAAEGGGWKPDAIVFDSSHSYGIPSYWNQHLYANSFQGVLSGSVQTLNYSLMNAGSVSVSVTIGTLNSAEQKLKASNVVFIHKIANFNNMPVPLSISINNLPPSARLNPTLDVAMMHSDDPLRENTFANPRAVAPRRSMLNVTGPAFTITLPAWSVHVIRAYASL